MYLSISLGNSGGAFCVGLVLLLHVDGNHKTTEFVEHNASTVFLNAACLMTHTIYLLVPNAHTHYKLLFYVPLECIILKTFYIFSSIFSKEFNLFQQIQRSHEFSCRQC